MQKIIVASFASFVFSLVLNVLPGLAHEGTSGDHLILGLGIGEAVGLIVGLVTGALSVLALAKYRKSKSQK